MFTFDSWWEQKKTNYKFNKIFKIKIQNTNILCLILYKINIFVNIIVLGIYSGHLRDKHLLKQTYKTWNIYMCNKYLFLDNIIKSFEHCK